MKENWKEEQIILTNKLAIEEPDRRQKVIDARNGVFESGREILLDDMIFYGLIDKDRNTLSYGGEEIPSLFSLISFHESELGTIYNFAAHGNEDNNTNLPKLIYT